MYRQYSYRSVYRSQYKKRQTGPVTETDLSYLHTILYILDKGFIVDVIDQFEY